MNIWKAIDLVFENDLGHRAAMRRGSRDDFPAAPMRLKVHHFFTIDPILNETLRYVTTLSALGMFYQDCRGKVAEGVLVVSPKQLF